MNSRGEFSFNHFCESAEICTSHVIGMRVCNCLTPQFSCKHSITLAAKPHPKSGCQLQRSLGGMVAMLAGKFHGGHCEFSGKILGCGRVPIFEPAIHRWTADVPPSR